MMMMMIKYLFLFLWCNTLQWTRPSKVSTLHDHAQRRTKVGMTPLDVWSARRRDLYLTTHKIHKKQTSMPPTVFEPTIQASERPSTHALDRAAIGIGSHIMRMINSTEIRQWSGDKLVQILVAKTELAM